MITNKDIRVENGSLIINGDPYPLDGQSPEAIMKIVKDNSDTTPTENSDAPVKSAGIKTYVDSCLSSKFEWKVAGEFSADGNITLDYSLDSASEIMINLFLGVARQTVLIDSISRLREYSLFPDFLTYEGRIYARITYVDATHVTISQLTGLSALGETAKFIIEIR